MQEERLERIPSVKQLAEPADVMPSEEAEYKVCQYCHLWTMYADSSVELKKKSELSQESAVAACKMYVPYISNITRQIEEVVKIFAMEKELRLIKNRGYFPVPQLTSHQKRNTDSILQGATSLTCTSGPVRTSTQTRPTQPTQ